MCATGRARTDVAILLVQVEGLRATVGGPNWKGTETSNELQCTIGRDQTDVAVLLA